ncbi:hypothetical protein BVRB_9g212930 [Beta vulgaris subsp. vulgaris]|nr:hypothetical protein BVRB_9g212930 [Beta vulgaris subsp. vulgaris]
MDENQYEGFSTPTSHTSSDRTTGSNALTVPSKKTKRAGPPEGRRRAPIWDHYVFSQRSSDFDVLKYWQSQCSAYLIISRMAKDILAIPITSVASESSFSMGGRVLTKYRSSLLPKNVEAFVTTQNWLFGYLKEEELESCLNAMDETDCVDDDIDVLSLPLELCWLDSVKFDLCWLDSVELDLCWLDSVELDMLVGGFC